MTRNKTNKEVTEKGITKTEYEVKMVEQTISTDRCMFGRISKKGNHIVLQNTDEYDFTILIEKKSLEELLEGTHETDYVFANFLVNEE